MQAKTERLFLLCQRAINRVGESKWWAPERQKNGIGYELKCGRE